MAAEKKFYVYEHVRPDTGEVFYVGKGTKDRVRYITRRGPHHKNIVAKLARSGLSPEVRIILETTDESEAFRVERDRIAYWRLRGVKLANLTDGGEGASGLILSDETRAKIREATKRQFENEDSAMRHKEAQRRRWQRPEEREKARLNNMKQFSNPIARERAAEAQKRNWENPDYRQKRIDDGKKYYQNPDARKHQSEMHNHQKRPIICLNNGITYDSVIMAAKELGLRTGNISNVCKGRARHTGGYRFQYADKA